MVLDEAKILETAQRMKAEDKDKSDLKELLGGKKLDDILDQTTQKALFKSIIVNGKVHKMLKDGNGIDILEGLLNNKICGDLSNFYMIKPDYILQLPNEQQINMANSIANGRKDLSAVLQNLWKRGIRTEACTTKNSDNIPMIQLNIKESEHEIQDMVQQIYEQDDIEGDYIYNYIEKAFKINLSGINLYEYLKEGKIPNSKIIKPNIFESAIKESLKNAEELYKYYNENGMDTSELEREISNQKNILSSIGKEKGKWNEENKKKNESAMHFLRKIEKKSWELESEEKEKIQEGQVKLANRQEKLKQQDFTKYNRQESKEK